jgi:hypothetical protein
MGEQRKGLVLFGLVDGDSRQLAVAVEDECLQDTFDVILIVCGVAGIWADRFGAAFCIAGRRGKSRDCELGNGVGE